MKQLWTSYIIIMRKMPSFLTILLIFLISLPSTYSFMMPNKLKRHAQTTSIAAVPQALVEPSERDANYGKNIAKYLVDLHDNKATFDFCGGMMFQLSLSSKLRDHLLTVANDTKGDNQPIVFDASNPRMFNVDGYSQDAFADNRSIFHGRELRQVPNAEGGMGFVLQLSLANGSDPEGWSKEEIDTYDGWGHDSGRTWRKANDYEDEGFKTFKQSFGPNAFGLNHRFYLHLDSQNRIWLAAEDGCEGAPAETSSNPLLRLFR